MRSIRREVLGCRIDCAARAQVAFHGRAPQTPCVRGASVGEASLECSFAKG